MKTPPILQKEEAALSNKYDPENKPPSPERVKQIIARLPSEVRKGIDYWREVGDELNPKVAELVLAINEKGLETTMSGDYYDNQLVYVEIEPPIVLLKPLPEDWILRSVWGSPGRRKGGNFVISLEREGSPPVSKGEAEEVASCLARLRDE